MAQGSHNFMYLPDRAVKAEGYCRLGQRERIFKVVQIEKNNSEFLLALRGVRNLTAFCITNKSL